MGWVRVCVKSEIMIIITKIGLRLSVREVLIHTVLR